MIAVLKQAIGPVLVMCLVAGGWWVHHMLHQPEPELATYYGTYRGFAPTDESAIYHGEFEMIITPDTISVRLATGLEIHEETIPTNRLVRATREEVATNFKEGSDLPDEIVGFRDGGLFYLFFKDPGDEPGLMIRGHQLADLVGYTTLFTPEQVERGAFAQVVASLTKEYGDVLPRLENGGKRPNLL